MELQTMRKIISLLTLSLTFLNSPVFAKTLIFVDKNNQPLENVVVSTQAKSPSEQSDAPVVVMDQVDKQFVPYVLLIQKGQQVAFPNSDNIRHHVYSFSEAKAFEIKLYSGDEVAPVTFDKDGVVVLGCNIHDSMIGYIYVHDGDEVWLTEASGRVSVPDNVSSVDVWHPHLNVVKSVMQTVQLNDTDNTETISLTLQAAPKEPEKSNTFGKRSFGG